MTQGNSTFVGTDEGGARKRQRELRVTAEAIRMSAYRAEIAGLPGAVDKMREAWNIVIDAEWDVWGQIHALSSLPVEDFFTS
jgi:hypothetical protein